MNTNNNHFHMEMQSNLPYITLHTEQSYRFDCLVEEVEEVH